MGKRLDANYSQIIFLKYAPYRLIIFLFIISLYFSNSVFTQERISPTDKIIAGTFKSLAKAAASAVDIDKIKKANIVKLQKMSEEKFRGKYLKIYDKINTLPLHIKTQYGITQDMNKKQAIQNIRSLDKAKAYELIDSIPDMVIAGEFRQYLYKTKEKIQKSNLIEQIHKVWSKIIGKI